MTNTDAFVSQRGSEPDMTPAAALMKVEVRGESRQRGDGVTVLVVDDDSSIASLLELNLRLEGYNVVTAPDGCVAIQLVHSLKPELVILDVMMPGALDGFAVCRYLRSNGLRDRLSIIMLTGCSETSDHLRGFRDGADDYVNKPFDPEELLGRVRATLRRARELRAVNPLTGLPGNLQIERELEHRIGKQESVALLYADLDSFKAYNDRYGFLRGDTAIRTTARILSVAAESMPNAFVGHIGGDDFAVVTRASDADEYCALTIDAFDACVPNLYDEEDARRGGISIVGRRGETVLHPFLSLSIGGASNVRQPDRDHRELVAIASEMKAAAKAQPGSAFVLDRRGHAES